MKRKKSGGRKLVLKSETVTNLTPVQAKDIKGGMFLEQCLETAARTCPEGALRPQ
jgi:ferredoxin